VRWSTRELEEGSIWPEVDGRHRDRRNSPATVAESGDDGDAQSVSRLDSLHQEEDEDEADLPVPSGRCGDSRNGGAMVA
jgi:hypothetical protein